jgi:hypothetical protein
LISLCSGLKKKLRGASRTKSRKPERLLLLLLWLIPAASVSGAGDRSPTDLNPLERLASSANVPGQSAWGDPPCPASQYTSNLVKIPAPNTGNNDKNPQRIQPRNLFDASIGEDNIFKGDRYKWSLRLMGVNIANKYALYNFLSTFSGTHYVTPRALSAEVGFHF